MWEIPILSYFPRWVVSKWGIPNDIITTYPTTPSRKRFPFIYSWCNWIRKSIPKPYLETDIDSYGIWWEWESRNNSIIFKGIIWSYWGTESNCASWSWNELMIACRLWLYATWFDWQKWYYYACGGINWLNTKTTQEILYIPRHSQWYLWYLIYFGIHLLKMDRIFYTLWTEIFYLYFLFWIISRPNLRSPRRSAIANPKT